MWLFRCSRGGGAADSAEAIVTTSATRIASAIHFVLMVLCLLSFNGSRDSVHVTSSVSFLVDFLRVRVRLPLGDEHGFTRVPPGCALTRGHAPCQSRRAD